jgi:hypothetical protein
MDTYDGVFFISICTIVVGLLAGIIKFCLKSKCEHFSLCYGLIKVDRRVDLEVQEEIHMMDKGLDLDDDKQKKDEKRTSITSLNDNI